MNEIISKRCPICNSPAIMHDLPDRGDGNYVQCYRCGDFDIVRTVFKKTFDEVQIANISGWLRENQKFEITSSKLEKLKELDTPSIAEKAIKLLKYIAKEIPLPGKYIQIDFQTLFNVQTMNDETEYPQIVFDNLKKYLPFLSITWSIEGHDLRYIIEDYLIQEKSYLTGNKKYKITPKGWAYLDKIRNINIHNDIVFIASKYEEKINKYLDNFVVSALEELGYKPKLMRSHPHPNIIDNEMISLIKQSKFIIVDLTKNSLGAYYEAGYAHGFGLEVIFLCEKSFRENKKNDKSKGVHFDTNHYPINDWEYKDGSGFKKKLCKLIDVKFGKGTYNPDDK